MSASAGILALLVGGALIAAPWWSSTLPASDYPLAYVLGAIFAGLGAYACLPERFSRLRTLLLAIGMGAFGSACAALAFSPLSPGADGTFAFGGIKGFSADQPMPWWARIAAGFFAVVLRSVAVLGLWGLLRNVLGSARADAARPPEDGAA